LGDDKKEKGETERERNQETIKGDVVDVWGGKEAKIQTEQKDGTKRGFTIYSDG